MFFYIVFFIEIVEDISKKYIVFNENEGLRIQ